MKTASSTSILRNSWMILALVVVLALLLSLNWYYFQRVRSGLDDEFSIRLQSLAALVSSTIDPSLFETMSPADGAAPGVDSLLSMLDRTKRDFQLSDILLLREDGVILLSLDTSLFRPGEFYPIWNMDHGSILSALEGTPSSTRLARAQGGTHFKAGYAPFPPGSEEARAVAAVEADAGFLGAVSDLRNMLTAATAASIIGLLIFIGFVVKATSSLLKTRESLLRSETLASMGRMAAGIAHEVRNPLFIIRSSAEKLRATHPDSSSEIEEFIIDEADRLDSIVGAYLQFARDEKSPAADADLSTILR
ncbi:MAG TPA: histidine kinase dimerization/phospho-acceptor domain-containing protein, partial [Candidatus Krumholzibacterium sp.]|nr:histidine kinase dimerization/phospho-acceptor domain-containing protein [Candidatus Krumholzibacterium sp.]